MSSVVVYHCIDTGNTHPIHKHPHKIVSQDDWSGQNAERPERTTHMQRERQSSVFDYQAHQEERQRPLGLCGLSMSEWHYMKDCFLITRIDNTLEMLTRAKYSTRPEEWPLASCPAPQQQEKTAFSSVQGLQKFTVMAFSLCNAQAMFKQVMESVLWCLT
jgi:hypothetical protein